MANKKVKEVIEENRNELITTTPDVLTKLSTYEQHFIVAYVNLGDKVKAIEDARKIVKGGSISKAAAANEADKILMKSTVKRAITEYKNVKHNQVSMAIANSGIKIAEIHNKLSTDTLSIDRMEERILSTLLKADAAEMSGDDKAYAGHMAMYNTLSNTKLKLEENVRKNLALVNDYNGGSKQKQIVKAGTIQIITGNNTINTGTKTTEYIDAIEGEVNEVNDIPDIDKL